VRISKNFFMLMNFIIWKKWFALLAGKCYLIPYGTGDSGGHSMASDRKGNTIQGQYKTARKERCFSEDCRNLECVRAGRLSDNSREGITANLDQVYKNHKPFPVIFYLNL
jgi:hypothetical protein